MRLSSLSMMGALMLAGACSLQNGEQQKLPVDTIDQKLAEVIESSEDANAAAHELGFTTQDIERAGPSYQQPANVVLPPEAIQPVTIDWQGPIEPLLQQMAERAGYTFNVKGLKPANQVIISITANEEPLFGVVRRAGAMAHGYAEIGFNPTTKVIEIRYRSKA